MSRMTRKRMAESGEGIPGVDLEEGVMTIHVLLERKPEVEAGLEQLNKRAKRKKLPPLTWSWGKPFVQEYNEEFKRGYFRPVKVEVIPITLPLETPKYAGWEFAATLQHLGGENIVRAVAGRDEDIPRKYRNAGPNCDHCRSSRQRSDTYLLRHEDGRFVQVGSSCLKDFLGSERALAIADRATFLSQVRALLEDEGWSRSGGGSRPPILMLSTYLAMVALFIREKGWVSKKMAQESPDPETTRATAGRAWDEFFRKLDRGETRAEPTPEDEAMAEQAIAWAENLSDAEVDKPGMGDYLHNVRAIARSGIAEWRTHGIAASMVAAYRRAMGIQERKKEAAAKRAYLDEWLGTVGEKITVVAKLDFFYRYETQYGVTTLLKFITPEGANVAWRASSSPVEESDVGKLYKVSGTVKGHDIYKDQKQTFVTRAKVEEVPEGTTLESLVEPPKKKASKKAAKPNARRIAIAPSDRRFLEANVLDPFLANLSEPDMASLAMSVAESLADNPKLLVLAPREERLLAAFVQSMDGRSSR